jgi:Exostosin family
MNTIIDSRAFLLLVAAFLAIGNLAQSKYGRPLSPATVQSHAEPEHMPTFRLNVSFYIHLDYDLNWRNATVGGKPYWPEEPHARSCHGKHSDDFWYMRSAWDHPMRTLDPNKAKLFFVPVLLNAVLDRFVEFRKRRRNRFCAHGHRDCIREAKDLGLLYQVNEALGQNTFFQRSNGTDHIIVLSHWQARSLPADVPNIHKCNTLTFEDEVPNATLPYNRIRMPGFYVGKPCPSAEKTHDFAMIGTFKHNLTSAWEVQRRNFQSRADVCEWLPGTTGTTIHCGPGDQCPALAQARYGFHVRGDTWGSNRLMDTLLSRTIPIFTAEEQYKILPSFYPWKEVSYLIEVSNRTTFQEEVEKLLNLPTKEYEEKLKKIDQYMYLLNHTLPYQFDGHMADLANKLGMTAP